MGGGGGGASRGMMLGDGDVDVSSGGVCSSCGGGVEVVIMVVEVVW